MILIDRVQPSFIAGVPKNAHGTHMAHLTGRGAWRRSLGQEAMGVDAAEHKPLIERVPGRAIQVIERVPGRAIPIRSNFETVC